MRRAVKCLGRNNQYSAERRCLQQGFIKPDDTRECLLPKCKSSFLSFVDVTLASSAQGKLKIWMGGNLIIHHYKSPCVTFYNIFFR
jgi:hypothetical protein